MDPWLKPKLEQLVGNIIEVIFLDEQGCTSEVSRLVTEKDSYILKSAKHERYRKWLKAEAEVLEQSGQEKGIPIPKYIGFFEEKNSSHLIMSYEPGITLKAAISRANSLSEKVQLIRSFGQFLNQFHENHQSEHHECEGDWISKQLAVAKEYVDVVTSGSPQLLRHLELNKPTSVPPTLIHGDCTWGNVLVFDGEVRMFIDVSGMTVGDPRYDETLAIGKFHNEPEFMRAFYEGYTRYKVSKKEIEFFDGLYEFF